MLIPSVNSRTETLQIEHVLCHPQVFKKIGGEQWSSIGALRKCIGDPNKDEPSDILDKEMADQRGDSTVRPCALTYSDYESG